MPFEEFYRQNFKTVYGFLIKLCKNSDLAEELTAETFLKAFEHYKSYNKKYKPSTWLCAIAKNEYLKYLRKQKKIDGFDNAEIADISNLEEKLSDKDTALRIPITVQKSDYWKGLVMIMNKNCNIVRDLIPLYSDNTASDESRKFIEEHCRTCDKCNRILSLSKTGIDKTAHLDDEINSVWKSIEKQNKKKRIIKVAIAAILVTVLIPLIIIGANYMYGADNTDTAKSPYFSDEMLNEFDKGYSQSDQKQLEPLLNDIKNVIDFNGEYETAKGKFGELAYYSYDRVEGNYTVKAKVELNSAKLYTDTGYMWIEYTKDLYTDDGTFWMTTKPVKSRITVINKDGEWTAVNIQSEQ